MHNVMEGKRRKGGGGRWEVGGRGEEREVGGGRWEVGGGRWEERRGREKVEGGEEGERCLSCWTLVLETLMQCFQAPFQLYISF